VFDDGLPGFFSRRFESGKASHGVKYNVGAQQRRLTLGAVVPGVLAEMRKSASDVLARARLGQDVVGDRLAAAGRRTVTLRELVPKYLTARESDLRPKSLVEARRYLERSWEPLHALPIDVITRQNVVDVVDDLEHDSGKVAADRARVALSGLFAATWTATPPGKRSRRFAKDCQGWSQPTALRGGMQAWSVRSPRRFCSRRDRDGAPRRLPR